MTAAIKSFDGCALVIEPAREIGRTPRRTGANEIEFRVKDPREITRDQQKKAYALLGDIAAFAGYHPQDAKAWMKWYFCEAEQLRPFSLSNVDRFTATAFVDYLVEFCCKWNVPTRDPLQSLCDDLDGYLYHCLAHRVCSVCQLPHRPEQNQPVHVHHVDRIGMGGDREAANHEGRFAVALCWKHHGEAHQMGESFFEKHHIPRGVRLDKFLCKKLNLTHEREGENV
jgi:hypothetical protein